MSAVWGRESRLAVIGAALCIFASCPNSDGDGESNEVVSARVSPARVENLDAPGDASAWALFDRNTRVGWSPPDGAPGGPAHLRIGLGKTTTITPAVRSGAAAAGYVSDNVQTYYFDTETQHWRRLARTRIDDKQRVVHSASDHFTTMIDAVVVSPEHPELRQFNPNALSGIQAADPGTGIRLVEAPTASSRGDANLGYAFDLPAGRHGLTPAVGLAYTSSR